MIAAQPYLHAPEQFVAAYLLVSVGACLAAAGLLWLAYVLIVPADRRRARPTADVRHVRDLGARLVEPIPAEYERLARPPELYDQRRDDGWMKQLLAPSKPTPNPSPGPTSSRGPGDAQTHQTGPSQEVGEPGVRHETRPAPGADLTGTSTGRPQGKVDGGVAHAPSPAHPEYNEPPIELAALWGDGA